MNLNLEKYLAGAGIHVKTIHRVGKFKINVFDRAIRARHAAIQMDAAGMTVPEIARLLHRPRGFVRQAIKNNWK